MNKFITSWSGVGFVMYDDNYNGNITPIISRVWNESG